MATRPKITIDKDAAPPAASAPPASTGLKPSEQMIQSAIEPRTIRVGGKTLSVRKPGVLAQFTLTDAMGDSASNQALMQMVMPLIYVGELDGESVAVPRNRLQVDALITALGDEGLTALMSWYLEVIVGPTMAAIDAARDQAALKN